MKFFLMLKGVTASKKKMIRIVSQTRTAWTLRPKDLTILAHVNMFNNRTRAEVLKLIRPYCQENFETTDINEKHIETRIMR